MPSPIAPPTTKYEVHIDFGRSTSWASIYNHTLSDVTNRLVSLDWAWGMADSYQEFAPPARATVVLRNHDNLLMPDNTSSAFYGLLTRGVLARIRGTVNGTVTMTWHGKLSKVVIGTDRMANPNSAVVTLTFEDESAKMQQAEFFPPFDTDVTTSTAISDAFAQAVVASPYEGAYWILGASTLGENTKLYDPAGILHTLNSGNTTLAYIGDNSDRGAGVNFQSYLRDIVAAELGGRFYYNAAVTPPGFDFHNRNYDITQYASSGSALTLYAKDIEKATYVYGDDVFNDVTVNYQPREVGTSNVVLGEIDHSVQVSPQQSREITLRFRDPDNKDVRVGGTSLVALESGVDYIANTASDGSGSDMTANLGMTVINTSGQSITLSLSNTSLSTSLYVTTLQQRGLPVYTYAQQSIHEVDVDSVKDYGLFKKSYSLKLVSDDDLASNYARLQVNRFKDPIGRFMNVTFVANTNNTLMGYASTTYSQVGTIITINDTTLTKQNTQYVIVGVRHSVTAQMRQHRVTWTLKPLQRERYWLLGVTGWGELGQKTYLGL